MALKQVNLLLNIIYSAQKPSAGKDDELRMHAFKSSSHSEIETKGHVCLEREEKGTAEA